MLSHSLTDEQKEDAQKNWGVTDFVFLPPDLQKKWSNIELTKPLTERTSKFIEFIKENVSKNDYILIQGEFGTSFAIIDWCLANNLKPIYSYTKRLIVEQKKIGNQVEKTSIFKHVKFLFYERIR